MDNLTRLTSSEVKVLLSQLSTWYGIDCTQYESYFFYQSSKERIHISSVDLDQFRDLKVLNCGMYFAKEHDNKRFRLSQEGAQLLQPKKNLLKLTPKGFSSYISGESLFLEEGVEVDCDGTCPFLIAVYDGVYLGCVSRKDPYYLNYISKGRKLDHNRVF
jgi:NOL1/NOP2/fmu family ribosome biogenesis protein